MKNLLKIIWPYLVALIPWVLLLLGISSAARCSCQRERHPNQPNVAQVQPMQRYTIHDTVEMVTQKVVVVEKVKEALTVEDKKLLKDLGVRLKAVESYQKIATLTEDTVTLQPYNSLADAEDKGSSRHQDSILAYSDAWLDLRYETGTRNLVLRCRDSLAVAVEREYRHRFLWWRWKVKGYHVKVANFNPHSSVKYNSYVKTK